MPTKAPGLTRVPRCLTMMLPGWQSWPPNSLTPSILGREPPLFWVEPPCFFDALQSNLCSRDCVLTFDTATSV